MLDELHVSNYALVHAANIQFSPGCTVLSGETGAGKTALVGAIKMIIGERAEVASIRDGSSELSVEGRFFDGQAEHIVARRLTREGRSRCTLNDSMVTVKALSEQIGIYFDLLGQHEHQTLLSNATQLKYIDRYSDEYKGKDALADYQNSWDCFQKVQRDLSEVKEGANSSAASLEQARFIIKEIASIDPKPGEYEELEKQLPILRNGEGLTHAAQGAYDALYEEGGALELLAQAQQSLSRESGFDRRLDDINTEIESLIISTDDLASTLRVYKDSIEFDPQALDEALERLGCLEGLRKRFGPRMEDVFDVYDKSREQIEQYENADEKIRQCEKRVRESEAELRLAATRLDKARKQASIILVDELNHALEELSFGGASLQINSIDLPFEAWQKSGSASYELYYKPTKTSVARPLSKIASGGELSRVMLALKTVQKEVDKEVTLVFDEVDAGIGGATAAAVAKYIARLAKTQQVIVVTHLPQIAAIADCHYVVEKQRDSNNFMTVIHKVEGQQRACEIARMLSGSVDKLSLDHANQLLNGGDEI